MSLGREKSVVLAVDRSRSMAGGALADAAGAARAFVAAKGGADRIQVVGFGSRASALTRFSSSTLDADAALAALELDAVTGTALYDAIVLAARGLSDQEQPGRVIVVVTDGRDLASSSTLADAIAAAQRAGASVYPIGIAGGDFTPEPLRALAAGTGGMYREASSSSQLRALYASIGRALSGTWELRYPTAARPGEELRLTAAAGGEEGTLAVPLRVAGVSAGPPAPPPDLLPRSAWRSSFAPLVVALAVGLLVLLAVAFASAARSGRWLSARLKPHVAPVARRTKAPAPGGRRRPLRPLFLATESAFAGIRQFRALRRLLERADLPLLAAELLYGALAGAFVIGLVAAVAGAPPLVVVAFMLAGGALPILFVKFKARGRVRAFDNQLPDVLVTIASTLKAGHAFEHAVQTVVDEGADPARKEFRRVLSETRLGRPMPDALSAMAERIGSTNFGFVITAVTIQRQIGGSLAELFDMVADTVRQRQQFARKIRGLTAMGRMSAYVLTGLPFFIALAVTLMNPAYMSPLYTTSTGHRLIVLGLVMMAVGTVILKRIVSFKT